MDPCLHFLSLLYLQFFFLRFLFLPCNFNTRKKIAIRIHSAASLATGLNPKVVVTREREKNAKLIIL
ncbi:Hypothetical predicted protein, partial [Olea europaea subsp. europaea]